MSLPVESVLLPLNQALRESAAVVLQAPPGAGKTTRLPLFLLDQSWLAGQTMLMVQPRRLAARFAAEYMAKQRDEAVGQTVGYTVRFDRKCSRATRIEVVTEGILTRRLQNDPELKGVGLVLFDEFHERNLQSDLALALCRDAQQGLREDLKLLVMSATLDAEPVAALLDHCPVITCQGRSFPVTTHYLPPAPRQRIEDSVFSAVERALAETSGDLLVFLPGAGEIRRCQNRLTPLREAIALPLYGALPYAQQQKALEPAAGRRVILATNIAETSLTIDGITAVIDTGLERRARFDPRAGITRLEEKRISVASATQRQGRAGRLGPGVCYRLWSEGQQQELLPLAPPEIRTADLSTLVLELACWGEQHPERLHWLDPPPATHLHQARDLLQQLGAIDARHRPTALGRKMVQWPLPPRLSRLLLAAHDDGCGALGCELAALLSEWGAWSRQPAVQASDCDLHDRWQWWQQHAQEAANKAIVRIARQLKKELGRLNGAHWPLENETVHRWLALAWPDRIGGQREPGSDQYLLADGTGAVLSPQSGLQRPRFLVALELAEGQGQPRIVLASEVKRTLLEKVFAHRLQPCKQVHWDRREGRVVAEEVRALNALTLSARPIKADRDQRVAGLMEGVRLLGLERLGWSKPAQQFLGRVRLCAACQPEAGWPDVRLEALEKNLEHWLAPFVGGLSTATELERFDPLPALKALLPYDQQQRLAQLAPERIEVPSGSSVRIDYAVEGSPVLAVKLQELFGWSETPCVLAGRVPLQIHLLSPARRPVAVTQDLKTFWAQVYPEVRKEMRGRYPRHPWPEDPWNAPATAHTRKKR